MNNTSTRLRPALVNVFPVSSSYVGKKMMQKDKINIFPYEHLLSQDEKKCLSTVVKTKQSGEIINILEH